ncbi:MAG: FeoC-like transcriptional regulator [Chloroflexaceae bacterium]
MLYQVLEALETATGPVSLDELSRQLKIESGALEAMIAFWVRKGRLRSGVGAACGGACARCGPQAEACVFNAGAPRTIALVEQTRNRPDR